MISYEVYKFIHVLSVFLIIFSLGGLIIHVVNGGDKIHPARKILASIHGTGALFALIAGFGLLARLGRSVVEPWVLAKVTIWIIFSMYSLILFKTKKQAKVHVIIVVALSCVAIFMAQQKPMF
ncbi:MAG: hypothetical protein KDD50_03650 [Bdellovibrionales bacterium]|nr:hypothetical protein [Bdellovibrionales bacterium]